MQEKVMPVMVRVPGTPAAVAIQKVASKLAGLKTEIDQGKKIGLLARILGFFKRKPKPKSQPEQKPEGKK